MEKFLKEYALVILLYIVVILGAIFLSSRGQSLQLTNFLFANFSFL